MGVTVIEVMRQFLPAFLQSRPTLDAARWRAIRSMLDCRTPAMGGHLYKCGECRERHFAYHSCNHKICPQCGTEATRQWVDRELGKLVEAPYFMVTFTLPQQMREIFFGEGAKDAFNLFFAASSRALAQELASPKSLGAEVSGATGVLHTWDRRLLFHPHIHYIVPGAGINGSGDVVTARRPDWLLPVPKLRAAFRYLFRTLLEERDIKVDPKAWTRQWGVDVRPFGKGENAVKYLGNYVCRTAIRDERVVSMDKEKQTVSFRWTDRQSREKRVETISGTEFVRRYLRHVLPPKLHSTRYYGFCHPAAKKKRERIAFHTGRPLLIGAAEQDAEPTKEPSGVPLCPRCEKPMKRVKKLERDSELSVLGDILAARGPPLSLDLRCNGA